MSQTPETTPEQTAETAAETVEPQAAVVTPEPELATPEPVAPAEVLEPAPAAPTEVLATPAPVPVPPAPAPTASTPPVLPTPVPAPAAVALQPAAPPREVVYVQAPVPPTARHNRGFGVLISVIGALTFGLLYVAGGAIIIAVTPGANFEPTFRAFTMSAAFWVPIAAYLVFAVLFALIANRAAWWSHVVGSLFVAGLTYLASVAALALMYNVVSMTPDAAVTQIALVASSPFLIVAAALARECALWFGLAISARGRRVRERNTAERAQFDQDLAQKRAEYERAHSA